MPDSSHDGLNYPLLLLHLGPARTRFDVDWLAECSSTNTLLLERATRGAPSGSVLVANHQTTGRGRRGRSWLSSPGCSLTFSVLWRLPPAVRSSGLSLTIGLAIAQALEGLGIRGVALKWPNDIWLNGRKLGGVLIEVAFDSDGLGLIIGIGLNLQHDTDWQAQLGQNSAALSETELSLPREVILGAILQQMANTLDTFSRDGFGALREAWCTRNALRGRPVRISSESGEHQGVCGDIGADGSLILHTGNGAHLLITGGDVSLIPLPV